MSGHTPGPWGWFGNANFPSASTLHLATAHSGRQFVMGFERWGMRGAQPTFQVDHRMVPAKELLLFEVGDPTVCGVTAATADDSVYRLDVRGINHPDARLIAAAPDLLEALHNMVALARPHFSDPSQMLALSEAEAAMAKARGDNQ